jgi:3-methylfumaryl-CoA hydratase
MSEAFSAWVGKTETVTDTLEPARSNALCAALGAPVVRIAGDPLPLLHHWLYFWDVRPPAALGVDGHPARGGFLPPVSLPRRMWAGGHVRFVRPLVLGDRVSRTSTILGIETKRGKSGDLVFVAVRHELSGDQGLAVVEEQDIVYREAAAGKASLPVDAPAPAVAWHREILPDPVLLKRYSGLTMNGHRIHYDRPYAIHEESYPALVVHGPLQATLLLDLGTAHLQAPVSDFSFRAHAPAFDGTKLHICGEPTATGADLWTEQGGIRNIAATIRCAG